MRNKQRDEENLETTRLTIYRKCLQWALLFSVTALWTFGYVKVRSELPDEIRLIGGREQSLSLDLPVSGDLYEPVVEAGEFTQSNIPENKIHLSFDRTVTIRTADTGNYHMECKLFGLIPLKDVELKVIEESRLIPAGIPIGIYVQTNGVLVIGTGSIRGMDGSDYEPAQHLLQSGDYIVTYNGQGLNGKEDLISRINNSGGGEAVLGIRRGSEGFSVKVKPVQTSPSEYKLGIWVRDNTQGIGTLTFVDDRLNFGALGHGINDVDTSKLMELSGGILYNTQIVSVVRGKNGSPGELTGIIDYNNSNILGAITQNTNGGIFGQGNELLTEEVPGTALPICLKQDIRTGPAQIICSIDGEPAYYNIEITKVDYSAPSINKGIVFKVTDENLLALTGGIVQGMSGSPIIQDGRLAGAVTHVFVQDSTKGFGIFIENMLEAGNIQDASKKAG